MDYLHEMRCFILDGKTPKEVGFQEYMEWVAAEPDRKVAYTEFPDIDVEVSTVFLFGSSHFPRFMKQPPMLFETMVFGGNHDGWTEKYSTWDEAEKGHESVVKLITESNANTSRTPKDS